MKNKIFNKLKLFIVMLLGIYMVIPNVFAAGGTCTITYTGNNSVTVGNNITLNLAVQNISGASDGVVSIEGNVVFDSDYLEYVSYTSASSLLPTSMNPSNSYKFAGVSMTQGGITSNSSVLTFVFKAKKVGSTSITAKNLEVCDSLWCYTVTTTAKTITITEATTSSSTTSSSTTSSSTSKKSSDATLSTIDIPGYTLSPSFDPDVTDYTVTVPEGTTSITINGTTSDGGATIESGTGEQTLTGDETEIDVKVKAPDGTEKTYKIVVKKETSDDDPGVTPTPVTNGDATLKSLSVSGYTISPEFSSSTSTYSLTVPNNVTGITVNAEANDSTSTVTISGNNGLLEGNNTVLVKVVATDGTTNYYTLNVKREASETTTTNAGGKTTKTTTTRVLSSDNTLKDLIINSSHTISPEFSSSVDSYTIVVPYDVTSLSMTPVVNNSGATYRILNNEDFEVGVANIVLIEVTAEDGSRRIITLNVTRTTDTDETDLSEIEIDGYDLEPDFDPDVLEYTIDVPAGEDSIDIDATAASSGSKVEVIGNENLKEGENIVLVKVTDKNGYVKYYQINVNKAKKTILGLTPLQFWIIFGIIGLLLLLLLLLLFLRRRKDDDEDEDETPVQPPKPDSPMIEFKPEFNFSSKNGTDDDTVYTGGVLNQSSNNSVAPEEPKRFDYEDYMKLSKGEPIENKYLGKESTKEIPYDPYDDVVTKDELVDAIQEGLETKNPEKLKILLEQESLNRRKEEMKKQEQGRR